MDHEKVGELVALAATDQGIAKAQRIATLAWPRFPKLGCAANLSALLQLAGINLPMTLGAGKLATILEKTRGWQPIAVGHQLPGDVGVAFDQDTSIPGADHVYLVIEVFGADDMIISDNQSPIVHHRSAIGRGRTPTDYFLRAT